MGRKPQVLQNSGQIGSSLSDDCSHVIRTVQGRLSLGGILKKEGRENIAFFDYLLIQEQKSRTGNRLHSGRDSQSRGKFSSYWLVDGCCCSFCFCLSAPFSILVIFKPWSALFAMTIPNNQMKTFFIVVHLFETWFYSVPPVP